MNLLLTDIVLRQKAEPATGPLPFGFIRAMFGLMRKNHGVGLAAPQVGYSLRVFVTDVPGDKPRVFVNPEIIGFDHHYTELSEEGCLSFPGLFVPIRRPTGVFIRALDKKGRPFSLDAAGLLARCIQHEYEHLDGIVITDRRQA
ncbi:MAG: peptide deformylase [Spirochaetes bacterium]|nr:peptide deformylase [Spirochaetota bacterium]